MRKVIIVKHQLDNRHRVNFKEIKVVHKEDTQKIIFMETAFMQLTDKKKSK